MIVFSCKNMEMSFGADVILENVDLSVNEGDRIGVIGSNGAGKTTLIRIFTGEYQPTGGQFFAHSSVKNTLGYLRQDSGLDSELTVYGEFILPFSHLKELEAQIAETESRLVKFGDSEATGHVLSARLASLYEKYNSEGGLTYESRVRSILKGLGFPEDTFGLKISSLSGGQKTRLALGKLLLSRPAVLILDEPTNHLDADSCVWLENELKTYNGTLIVISHDRAFLDSVTTSTLLIEHGGAFFYKARYSDYLPLRQADVEYRRKCYIQQQKEIARINAFIENQRRWNRERNIIAAESRMKYLDRMKLIDKPPEPDAPPSVVFETDRPGGKEVLKVEGLGFSYPGRKLFADVSAEIMRGERVFITGPNGCGKTTFLKTIAGKLAPGEKDHVSGSFRFGGNVSFSYYSQDLSDVSGDGNVFDALYDRVNEGRPAALLVPPLRIRNSLAAMGFRGSDVFKDLKDLSGGEKSRLQLLMISYEKSQLLILDEPTNHLDIGSREVLEEALMKYEGTVIAVSHDRYFREKLATRTIDISSFRPDGGNNDADEAKKRSGGAGEYRRQKEIRSRINKLINEFSRLESRLAELEKQSSDAERMLEDPEIASDHVRLGEIYGLKDKTDGEMLGVMDRMEQIKAELDSL